MLNHYGGSFWLNLWENTDFDLRNLTIWLIIDKSIKNHQNLINQLDFWNKHTLVMMKFYFLRKFNVEITHLSTKFSHIWVNIENFTWKLELIWSVFFVNFPDPDSKHFLQRITSNYSTIHDLCFYRTDFRVSISLLIIMLLPLWSVKCVLIYSYSEIHMCTHLNMKTYNIPNNSHVNQTVRSYALHTIFICWGRDCHYL